MDNKALILDTLARLHIPYALHEHEPKWTIEDCLKTPGLDPTRATMPKNVFLCNRQQTAFHLVLLSPRRAFRPAVVSKLLGVSRLSFAPEGMLFQLLGLGKGAVSPLGLVFDEGRQVSLVVDRALLAHERLWFHPGVNTASLEMRTDDFMESFLPGLGRKATIITLPENEEDTP